MSVAILDELASRFLGDRPGDHRHACPICAKAGRDDAVSVTVKDDGTVVAYCHRCNENGTARPDRINGSRRPAPRARAARPPEDHVALWESGVAPGEAFEHAYLTRKQVEAHGIRVAGDLLLVPMHNAAGELVGVEKIKPDGTKLYIKGTKKTGAFHRIGDAARGRIVVCEGYATGASIHQATGETVAVAFDAGNLVHVAKTLRAKYPALAIIVAADDDIDTAGNPGLTKAEDAASAIDGLLAVPDFGTERPAGLSDFNDLAVLGGAEAVRKCFGMALLHPEPEPDDAALAYVFAHELDDNGDEADELVEGLLTRGAMSVIYGDSNSGKTFLAIDIACALARCLAWMGRNVEAGLIVYLATESPASVRRRLRAYQRHHACKVPNFAIVQSPINLYDGAADTKLIIDLVHRLEQRLGVKCELVIGDTLSRLCAGANENSGEDMSIVVRHVERIRHECHAHFLLIHHTGKNAALGMRGWSGMRAATDTEVEITAADDTGTHAAEVTKQRDIPGKGERIGFRLQVVEMGVGKWGKPITSCVVVSTEAPVKQPGKRPSVIEGAIIEFLSTKGSGIKKRDLAAHFDGRYLDTSVYKEIRKMVAERKLHEALGMVSLALSEGAVR